MVHDVTLHDIYHALGMKNGDVFKMCPRLVTILGRCVGNCIKR